MLGRPGRLGRGRGWRARDERRTPASQAAQSATFQLEPAREPDNLRFARDGRG